MPLARIGTTMLYFSHIPKTGGTSVEHYLRAKGSVALVARRTGYEQVVPQHMPARVAEAYFPDGFVDASFAVLRDPVDRLVSAFKMRASEGHVNGLNPLDWVMAAWGKISGRKLYRMRIMRVPVLLDFQSWVALVFLARRFYSTLHENHVTPQAEFVSARMRLFRFEDGLEPVFDWIDTITGTPRAEGQFHRRRSGAFAIDVPPRLRARIQRYYADDYALLAKLNTNTPT
jgi:hypothetical protein